MNESFKLGFEKQALMTPRYHYLKTKVQAKKIGRDAKNLFNQKVKPHLRSDNATFAHDRVTRASDAKGKFTGEQI